MFSNMKKKEYMELELSDEKVVTKNIVFVSLGTQRKVFSLLNSTLVSFVWKECHFV